MTPDDILPTYARHARAFAANRAKTLFERGWLDRALNHAPGRQVLDLGCGAGDPIARYLADRRAQVTGVDATPDMIEMFSALLPRHQAIMADMRSLSLDRQFDVILAWDSFFHLSPDDQRAMFAVFAAHAAPGAVLMFTSGPDAGEAIGQVEGSPIYHSSLSPKEYRHLLDSHGFQELAFTPEDPTCDYHSVWMARKRITA